MHRMDHLKEPELSAEAVGAASGATTAVSPPSDAIVCPPAPAVGHAARRICTASELGIVRSSELRTAFAHIGHASSVASSLRTLKVTLHSRKCGKISSIRLFAYNADRIYEYSRTHFENAECSATKLHFGHAVRSVDTT